LAFSYYRTFSEGGGNISISLPFRGRERVVVGEGRVVISQ